MSKHFQCTSCGKCCFGQLPLSWQDAIANVSRFPLALVWTPVQQGSRDFTVASRLGSPIKLPDRKEIAVLIMPTSFVPSTMPCPALRDNNLCGIHANKPSRCKTMPFYPYRSEQHQADLLEPRSGWECDTSVDAPLVYQDRKILARKDFDAERQELIVQVPMLRQYAAYMLKYTPSLIRSLSIALRNRNGGQVVTSLSSFLTATRSPDASKIAALQLPVLKYFVAKTEDDSKLVHFHKYYSSWAKEMAYLVKPAHVTCNRPEASQTSLPTLN